MKYLKLLLSLRRLSAFLVVVIFVLIAFTSSHNPEDISTNDRTISFDKGWRFLKDTLSGAESHVFNDSGWRIIDIPHDWGIEDLPAQNGVDIIGPFDKSSIDKGTTGYLVGGTGWYRKTFTIREEDKEKIACIQFDGAAVTSDVWLNGRHLGFHPNAYIPFYYDITSYLNPPGKPNLVAVRVKNDGMNSRWYTGSGIIRHVWLTLVNPVHIDISGGLYITTPVVLENLANVKVESTIINSGKSDESIVLRTSLFDPSGKLVVTLASNAIVASGKKGQVIQEIPVQLPFLWSIDEPNLYHAKVTVLLNNKIVDCLTTHFGIRSIKADAQNGFTINGKPFEMIGGCIHHDNGPLGAAAFDRAEERKIEVLKNNGFNAIRTAHNPPSSALLDACDRLGMLVINEFSDVWETAKRSQDYHLYFREWWQKDVDMWVKRDRNHASVIIWSIGNEIRETFDTTGLKIARNLTKEILRIDTTRWVTECFVDFAWMRGQKSKWDEIPEHLGLFDVIGYNYAFKRYEEDHIKYPHRVMVGTETNPPLALENFEMARKHPYVIGYFVWTAMDNLGESGVGVPILRNVTQDSSQALVTGQGFFSRDSWPAFTNYQGDIDLIGNRKVPSYYQHVVWGKSKIEMFVHRPIPEGKKEVTSNWGFPDELKSWNWTGYEGEKMQVHVYARCQQVQLKLNGKIVGEQIMDREKSITSTFEVPYVAGELIASCYENGKEAATQSLKTTGKPTAIRLLADRTKIKANCNDLSFIRAEIIDSEGNIVPDADDIMISFDITGEGCLAGAGSGNPLDMSSFQQPKKKTWKGICMVIVRTGTKSGKIRIRATAAGLKSASITISAERCGK